jgi:prepilin-type N-terminal cleavage/methylation domain-containing protein
MQRIQRAFTLIELLIVVAIIAILAAIAVPNFLEAQTRAKVSRVKADMRSVAAAIESYHIDFNHYPFPQLRGLTYPNLEMFRVRDTWEPYGVLNDSLSTPTAYITALPRDIFKDAGFGTESGAGWNPPHDSPWHRFSYTQRRAGIGLGNEAFTISIFFDGEGYAANRPEWMNASWIMVSLGPDRTEDIMSPWNPLMPEYDPTNGTISKGDITRHG